MGLEMDAATICTSFFVSMVGFGVFLYGRNQRQLLHKTVGMGLMVCPYFVSNPVGLGLLAAAVLGGLFVLKRFMD